MLEKTPFAQVNDLFIYQRKGYGNQPTERYRILVGTTHKTIAFSPVRKRWEMDMKANAVSGSVTGKSHTFSMNQLMEATFFHNKNAFVERTKTDHLQLFADYKSNIDVYINGLTATPDDVKTVHIRDVDKLYTRERPYEEWAAETNPEKRYILYIETAPKRAKRDSTYYVFSPFYSGDF